MKWAILLIALLALCVMSAVNMFLPYPNGRARVTDGQEKIVTKDDGRAIAYFVQGSGKPIVLLASAGREASDFNELATTLLAQGYKTIAVEAPGIGQSTLPSGDMTLFDLADDIAMVLNAELKPDEQSIVIGHAFGNRVARAIATRHGDLVEAVILIAAGGKKPISPRADRALKASFDPLNVASRRIGNIRYAFFANGNAVPEYWQRGWHIGTAQLQGKAVQLTDVTKWWLGGNKPILVIQGANDTIAPVADAGQALVDDGAGRVEMVIVRDAGHAILPEQPVIISDAILAYAAKLSKHDDHP